jgi:flavin-dependent dehydrogenase
VIAGAGPAGSLIAARLAAGGMNVLLVEATAFDRPRVGEFLSPRGRAVLNQCCVLKSGWEQEHRLVQEFVSTWGFPDPVSHNYIFDPFGQGIALDRAKFDRELAGAAAARGARLETCARIRGVVRSRDAWEVEIDQRGVRSVVSSGFLVVCSGRGGSLLRNLGVTRQRLDQLVCLGLRMLNYEGDGRPTTEAYANGWAYSICPASGELIVNLFVERPRLPASRITLSRDYFLKELADCPLAASRVLASKARRSSDAAFFVADASSMTSRPITGPGWCLAGDCAQAWDPLSSGGITQALEQGVMVSDAILGARSVRDPELSEYAAHLETRHAAYVSSRRHVYGLEKRWATPFWASRQ